MCSYYNTHTICKRTRGPHSTTWRAAGWTPMLESLFMRAACPAHLVFLKTHITTNVLTFNSPHTFVFTYPFSTHKPHINNYHVFYFTIPIKGQEKFIYVRWKEKVQTRMWGVLHRGGRSYPDYCYGRVLRDTRYVQITQFQ